MGAHLTMPNDQQKIAIITGASAGIGLATTQLFLSHQWRVINVSRRLCPLDNVENIQVDLSEFDFDDLSKQLLAKLPKKALICLIHNASYHASDAIETVTTKDFSRSLQVGVIAPSQLNQIILPVMTKGSSILYMGSTLSEKAVKHAASYVTTKHAVVGLMRATCQDLDQRFIHTACICPGFTDTDMLKEHLSDHNVREQIIDMVSFRRLIHPDEIAQTLWFCANHPVINGSVLHANLGQLEK